MSALDCWELHVKNSTTREICDEVEIIEGVDGCYTTPPGGYNYSLYIGLCYSQEINRIRDEVNIILGKYHPEIVWIPFYLNSQEEKATKTWE